MRWITSPGWTGHLLAVDAGALTTRLHDALGDDFAGFAEYQQTQPALEHRAPLSPAGSATACRSRRRGAAPRRAPATARRPRNRARADAP